MQFLEQKLETNFAVGPNFAGCCRKFERNRPKTETFHFFKYQTVPEVGGKLSGGPTESAEYLVLKAEKELLEVCFSQPYGQLRN